MSLSRRRIWTAMMPCPTAGTISSIENVCEMRAPSPSLSRPATASTIASRPLVLASRSSLARTILRRVSTFPWSSTTSKSCLIPRSCAFLLRLLVPTFAPLGSVLMVPPLVVTRASRGSLLGGVAPITRPWVGLLVKSFMLCIAMSISPFNRRVSMSRVNAPLAPARLLTLFASGGSRSPRVFTGTNSSTRLSPNLLLMSLEMVAV